MLVFAGKPAKPYVGPFDRICRGLRALPRNYRLERSVADSVAETIASKDRASKNRSPPPSFAATRPQRNEMRVRGACAAAKARATTTYA